MTGEHPREMLCVIIDVYLVLTRMACQLERVLSVA